MIFNDEFLLLLDALKDHFEDHGNVSLPIQLLKVQEEAGEMAEAYLGMFGFNPMKGVTHKSRDLVGELADIVMTALIAIKFAGYDPDSAIAAGAVKAKQRLAEWYEQNGIPNDKDQSSLGDDGGLRITDVPVGR